MAYDETLAERIRKALPGRAGWTERKMFGGLAFLSRGQMRCGIVKDQLMVRVGPKAYEKALAAPRVHPMDFTGRPMRGFIYVDPPGTRTEASIRKWIRLALAAPKPQQKKRKAATRRKSGKRKQADAKH